MSIETDKMFKTGDQVKISGRDDLGIGEVLRVSDVYGIYQADIVFENGGTRKLEIFPIEKLESAPDLWKRAEQNDFDNRVDFLLKQLAVQIPLQNSGGQLTNSRTHLLPHQILLTRDIVASKSRRFLIADEVGLGKTIETAMILKELATREQADRILIITPAGLTRNWQDELRDSFRLNFEILGIDFMDNGSFTWEAHNRVIASIDTIKRPQRLEKLLNSPRWDLIVVDEAHHLSRIKYGSKVQSTLNYKLAESLRAHTRDLLFLSATPHQGNRFQFWSLIQLLNDSLFESENSLLEHKGLLNRVMIRRTKKEVTDRNGKPIFMKRKVNTQSFQQSAQEKMFYEKLTEYLREGYSAAGVGKLKTTNEQRAIGFVMTTFQKIMSSSLRAIRQALRKRLIVLYLRNEMRLVELRKRNSSKTGLAEEILNLQDEMKIITAEVLGVTNTFPHRSDIESYISQARAKLSKRYKAMEETRWSLDSDEEMDDELLSAADIPNETELVKDLLKTIPDKTDRKFDTLTRAIDSILNNNPTEKFIIFTQYLETLNFLMEGLGKIYGDKKIAVIKGGPLEQKIEAQEKFWEDDGAQFLISTSAGGEGINLQKGKILFNYDLPWNPMAVEQRIGRIHRYGQHDTVQVYNLIAEETIEEKIYKLLETKLNEIAEQIGKIDRETGEATEDFRTEILGFLGSAPNYLELYKKAILDRDYSRTENEIREALRQAKEASEALSDLTQDLKTFDLQDYLNLEGKFSLNDLEKFVRAAILRMGGSMLPEEHFYIIETPGELLTYENVLNRYRNVTFDREAAMRKKSAELFGIGHPLVNAIIEHLHKATFKGDISEFCLENYEKESYIVLTTLISIDLEDGNRYNDLNLLRISGTGDVTSLPANWLINKLEVNGKTKAVGKQNFEWQKIKSNYVTSINAIMAQTKMRLNNPLASRVKLLGIAVVN